MKYQRTLEGNRTGDAGPDDELYLVHIRECIGLIEEYIRDVPDEDEFRYG